jgi:hypothetical protein
LVGEKPVPATSFARFTVTLGESCTKAAMLCTLAALPSGASSSTSAMVTALVTLATSSA